MSEDILNTKRQWCELCHTKVSDVEPSKPRSNRRLMMVCSDCRKLFPNRQQVWWGKQQYQFYWDLGVTPVPPITKYPTRNRRWYEVECTEQQMVWLRAAGYEVHIETKKENDEDEGD